MDIIEKENFSKGLLKNLLLFNYVHATILSTIQAK